MRSRLWSRAWIEGAVVLVVITALSHGTLVARADAEPRDPRALESVPIELTTNLVFVPVSVDGSEPMWFLLDSGAARCVLHDRTVDRLAIETSGSFPASGAGAQSIDARFIPELSLAVGDAGVRSTSGIAIDLSGIERRIGRDVDGILGYDLFDQYVVEVDYGNDRLALYDAESFEHEGEGFSVPIELAGNHIVMPARLTLGGRETMDVELLVDTGAGLDVMLTTPFVRKTDGLETLEWSIVNDLGQGIAGKTTSVIGPLESIEIGGVRLDAPLANFSQDESGAAAWTFIDGILGSGVLQRFTVTFDYGREVMHFEPNDRIDEPFERDLFGAIWVGGGEGAWDEITVEGVFPGSLAAQAGVRAGDRLVSFNRLPAAEWTVSELYDSGMELGAEVTLVIERDGAPIERSIVLKEWFK